MNRPQTLRAIYIELKRSLAGELTSGQILVIARQLYDAYEEPWRLGYEYTSDAPITIWPALDVAFADGGWRVMAHERASNDNENADEVHLHLQAMKKVHRLLRSVA